MKPSNTVVVSTNFIKERNELLNKLDRAKKTLCEADRIALSEEKDISKIHDIVYPTILYLNEEVK